MNDIDQLSLNEKHLPEIKGLGEIYHIISVERLQRKLLKKFGSGILFLSPNSLHADHGLSRGELEDKVEKQGYKVLASGYVDSPPWLCRPRFEKSPFLFLAPLAKLLFPFLVRLEPLREGEKNSHMVFVLGKKNRSDN